MPFKAKLSFRDNFRLAGGSYVGFSGIYDDLRIYNKTLDADTVQKLYLSKARHR